MTSPSHIIYNLFLLGKKSEPQYNPFIVLGAVLPDIPMFLFYPVMLVLGKSSQEIWNVLYFESGWQVMWSISHSLWIWPLSLWVSIALKYKKLQYLFGSMILHICLDFVVHSTDAYSHLWPFSNWRFYSPISYYDPHHFGNIVSVVDAVLCIICVYFLYRRLYSR
jgi:hypothetical protein